jgi:fucose permease
VYALMALVAGVLLDRYGARRTVPLGIAIVAVGCVVFAQGAEVAGMTGFVIQAIGAVFAFSADPMLPHATCRSGC